MAKIWGDLITMQMRTESIDEGLPYDTRDDSGKKGQKAMRETSDKWSMSRGSLEPYEEEGE